MILRPVHHSIIDILNLSGLHGSDHQGASMSLEGKVAIITGPGRDRVLA